jgi:hypothetical protein
MKRDKDFVLLGSTASGDAGEGAPRRKDSLFPNRDGLREFLKAHDKELCEDCGCCERVKEPCETCGGDGGSWEESLDMDDDEWWTCDVCRGIGSFGVCIGNCGENGHERDGEA